MLQKLIEILNVEQNKAVDDFNKTQDSDFLTKRMAYLDAIRWVEELQQKVRCENCKWWDEGECQAIGVEAITYGASQDQPDAYLTNENFYCKFWEEKWD